MSINCFIKKVKFSNTGMAAALVAVLCFVQAPASSNAFDTDRGHKIAFVGPRQKVFTETPVDSGFWSFTIAVPNVLSRSGQPSMTDFRWLKDHGYRSVVDLRISDDSKIPGFNELHFNYLALPTVDGSVPSDLQAQQFLRFVTDPKNQPTHVHCRAGVGRTGVMTALYRYMVQGWSIDEAISESRLFKGGVNKIQENWLRNWAHAHKPGSFQRGP